MIMNHIDLLDQLIGVCPESSPERDAVQSHKQQFLKSCGYWAPEIIPFRMFHQRAQLAELVAELPGCQELLRDTAEQS